MRRVNKVDYCASLELIEMMPAPLVSYYRDLAAKGWAFLVAAQDAGFCRYATKTIVIPTWATTYKIDYLTWYIAHEMSHAYAGPQAKHGPAFMSELKRICPNDCIKYELGYKPRNAANSGITQHGVIEVDYNNPLEI